MMLLEKLKVIIEASASPLKKEMKDALNSTKQTANNINKEIKKATNSVNTENDSKTNRNMKSTQNAVNNVTAAVKRYKSALVEASKTPLELKESGKIVDQLANTKNLLKKTVGDVITGKIFMDTRDAIGNHAENMRKKLFTYDNFDRMTYSIGNYVKEAQKAAGIKINTGEYETICADLKRAEKQFEKLIQKKKDVEASGIDKESAEWQKIINQIKAAEGQVERYKAAKYRMEGTGNDVRYADGLASQSWIGTGVATAEHTVKSASATIKQFTASIGQALGKVPILGRVLKEAAYLGKTSFSKLLPVIRESGGLFASLIKKFASGIPIINRFTGATSKTNNSFGNGIKNILKYGLGIRSLFVLFNKLRTAIVDGFKNLAQFDAGTNKSLSMLSSSLSQLKNSLATAFAPILNYIAPALNTLIQMAISAANAVGQLFSALTGKNYVVRAAKVNNDYAASLNKSSSGANDAAAANEKLKNSILGFDEINKLDDSDQSGSNGGSGGGSGAVGAGAFYTEAVSSEMSNLAQMIKEAWENADFTEIGKILGEKLNSALKKIPWSKIKGTVQKIAKSIATFLNGFIKATNWKLVGKTFAEGINIAIEFGYTYVTTFDWSNFGKSIGDAINGLVANIEWAKAAKIFSEGFKGILSSINTAIRQINWTQIGQSIGEFLVNIDWLGILAAVGTLIANALVAGMNFVTGFFRKITEGLENCNWKDVVATVWKLFGNAWGLIKAVVEAGVKLVKSGWKLLSEFIGTLVSVAISLAKSGWSSLVSFVGDKVSAAISLAKSGWSSLTSFVGNKVSIATSLVKSGWSSIKSWLGISDSFKLSFKLPKIGVNWGSKTIAGFTIKFPSGFYTYAKGGFPARGQMFIANEAGPEMVGTMDGKTAVANNNQITSGIASAVYPAVYNAIIAAMNVSGGNGSQQINVYVGERQITDYFIEYVKNQTKMTGTNPVMV